MKCDLFDGYKGLYSCIQSEKYAPDKYTTFVAMKGERYDSLDSSDIPRLMIIGRAVNGWNREKLVYESEKTFADSVEKSFNDKTRFTTEWGLKSRKRGEYFSMTGDVKYYLSHSPFWNYSRSIWKELVEGSEIENEPDWLQYIVWSNLYKVSPRYGGNPDNKLCRIQAKSCIDILRVEIQLLKPTHIIMPVADRWLSWRCGDFSTIFTDGLLGTKEIKNIHSCDRKIVRRVFASEDLKVVVTNRPERRKQDKYVQEVIKAFQLK